MRVLADARDALPAEPGMWTRFGEGFVDTFSTIGTQAADFAGGAVDTTISMVGSVEKMNATSGYNITPSGRSISIGWPRPVRSSPTWSNIR